MKDLTLKGGEEKKRSSSKILEKINFFSPNFLSIIWGTVIFIVMVVVAIIISREICSFFPGFSINHYQVYIATDLVMICLLVIADNLFIPIPARPEFVKGVIWVMLLIIIVQIIWLYNAQYVQKIDVHNKQVTLARGFYAQAQAVALSTKSAKTPQEKEELVKKLRVKIPLLRKAVRFDLGEDKYRKALNEAIDMIPWKEVPGSRTEVIGKGFGSGDKGNLHLPIKKLKKGDKYIIVSKHFQMKKYFGSVCKWVSYYGRKEQLCSWIPNGDPYAFRAEKGQKAVVFVLEKRI